ncbi:hypothetical protein F2Q69_00013282 [Brassica cretica]|uniref:Uncharacterized protein n=1 Tax=Brassica cretica TaxID=69181 RepID=A0A8S9R9Z7_BRACR|nr:hypothetical protein F2Q69_00013282 [Brassica cretica]
MLLPCSRLGGVTTSTGRGTHSRSSGWLLHAPLDGYFTHTAQSLRSDRAQAKLSRYVATEHAHGSVAT